MTQTAEPAESTAPQPREPLIREITLRNFLSFGPDTEPQELRALNVLIGPNGSGKSNLIEAMALMRAMPTGLRTVIRKGGGIAEWVWKGNSKANAWINVCLRSYGRHACVRHEIRFGENRWIADIDERIEAFNAANNPVGGKTLFSAGDLGIASIRVRDGQVRKFGNEELDRNESVLSQIKDPIAYPEITDLARKYAEFRLFREWSFGRNTVFREPQPADGRNDRLEEDFSNLGLFLNQLGRKPAAKRKLLEHLRNLYEGLDNYEVIVEGGTVQVFFNEGDFSIPARRLSDGTLRYLCLLAILCDPEPPPLICLEEPELGLHPDILPGLARLLVEASQRTQLIVTTHSEILVDALTEYPESIVVCEKHHGQTQMKRLNADDLSEWLAKYRLGQLWSSGQLGGNRW